MPIFAALDVHVRHTGRAMLEQQFGDLFVPGAIAGEIAILAAHPAVGAVFPAEIGDLHHGAHEDLLAEFLARRGGGAFMERRLALTN